MELPDEVQAALAEAARGRERMVELADEIEEGVAVGSFTDAQVVNALSTLFRSSVTQAESMARLNETLNLSLRFWIKRAEKYETAASHNLPNFCLGLAVAFAISAAMSLLT